MFQVVCLIYCCISRLRAHSSYRHKSTSSASRQRLRQRPAGEEDGNATDWWYYLVGVPLSIFRLMKWSHKFDFLMTRLSLDDKIVANRFYQYGWSFVSRLCKWTPSSTAIHKLGHLSCWLQWLITPTSRALIFIWCWSRSIPSEFATECVCVWACYWSPSILKKDRLDLILNHRQLTFYWSGPPVTREVTQFPVSCFYVQTFPLS